MQGFSSLLQPASCQLALKFIEAAVQVGPLCLLERQHIGGLRIPGSQTCFGRHGGVPLTFEHSLLLLQHLLFCWLRLLPEGLPIPAASSATPVA